MTVCLLIAALLCPAALVPQSSGISQGDLVKKAREAVRQAEVELAKARQKYTEGFPEDGEKAVAEMMRLIEQAYSWLKETKRDPRKQPAGFKDMEVKLRVYKRRLEDLKNTLPLDERDPIDKAIVRVAELNDEILLGLMNAKHPKKEK